MGAGGTGDTGHDAGLPGAAGHHPAARSGEEHRGDTAGVRRGFVTDHDADDTGVSLTWAVATSRTTNVGWPNGPRRAASRCTGTPSGTGSACSAGSSPGCWSGRPPTPRPGCRCWASDLPIADEVLPRFLDDGAATKLLQAARADADPFVRLTVEFLARTGLRKGE